MQRWKTILLMVLILICMNACGSDDKETMSLETVDTPPQETAQEVSSDIYVYVCGAVQREGVYRLPTGSRIYEAVEMAGGFREDAATSEVNQAEVLQDEARVYVPTFADVISAKENGDGKINLNQATKEELMTLPGVGEAKADSIIQYRNENGGFHNIEEIMEISGIKEGLFEKIKHLIKI